MCRDESHTFVLDAMARIFGSSFTKLTFDGPFSEGNNSRFAVFFPSEKPNRGLVFSGFDCWPLDLVLIFHVGLHNHVLQAFQEAKDKNM